MNLTDQVVSRQKTNMPDTTKRTNEEIAKLCIVMDFCEQCDECGGGKIVTKHETVALFIEALNAKDREREEVVAEAVRMERERIAKVLNDAVFDFSTIKKGSAGYHRRAGADWLRERLLKALATPQEPLTTPNPKDHE